MYTEMLAVHQNGSYHLESTADTGAGRVLPSFQVNLPLVQPKRIWVTTERSPYSTILRRFRRIVAACNLVRILLTDARISSCMSSIPKGAGSSKPSNTTVPVNTGYTLVAVF